MDSREATRGRSPILVFDGGCVLCNGTVKFVLRHEHGRDISFAATQSESGTLLLQRAGLDQRDPQTFLFIENDRILMRSEAALALAAYLRAPWRWLKWLRFIPRPWCDAVYDWVARYRMRLFGRTEICLTPAVHETNRFLP
jgi:predicted DCC family thiol-disulfide oxidoreductase YuxK